MKTYIPQALIIFILVLSGCKKNELSDNDKLTQKEQLIVTKIESLVPEQIADMLENHFIELSYDPYYSEYLDSFDIAIDDLIAAIETNFSTQEFKEVYESTLSSQQSIFLKSTTDDCKGIGYAKGVEIDISAAGYIGAAIVAGLSASGGGGVQVVYDFVNLDRQYYYYTFCGYGYTIGGGVGAALSASVGFSGINEILTGIRYHGINSGVNKFEGPALSQSHSISASLLAAFGLGVSIGIGTSQEAIANFSGIGNLLPCPDGMTLIENGIERYSFATSGSLSVGVGADIILAYSNNTIGVNSHGNDDSYHKFSDNRPLGAMRMAKEILSSNPAIPGLRSPVGPTDLAASTIAISYGLKSFSDCNIETSTLTDSRDGNIYKIVKIGNQWWMAENLAYLDEEVLSNGAWVFDYIGNDLNTAKNSYYYKKYGCLYDWETANLIGPDGWHLPSDAEWKVLEEYLGMSVFEINSLYLRNSGKIGNILKASHDWSNGGNGLDNYGFSALPHGIRFTTGAYGNINDQSPFWTSTEGFDSSTAYHRNMSYSSTGVYRNNNLSRDASIGIRFVKDD